VKRCLWILHPVRGGACYPWLVQQSPAAGKAGPYPTGRSGTNILCFHLEPGSGSL